jgi:putative ABC transport system permease protein
MSLLSLVLKELLFRKVSSLVILMIAITAGTVSVAVFTLSKASEDETRMIMREQGLNLYIFPKGTNLIDMYTVNNLETFSETYVDTLAGSRTFDAVRHLTGMLQVKYSDWEDNNGSFHQLILTGYKDEAIQRFLAKQEIMGYDVKKGTVKVGALVSKNIPEGQPFSIRGADGKMYNFEIAERLTEGKGVLDQGVSFYLGDLQQILAMPGRINKIEALGCVCKDGRIQNARKQVQAIFSDLEVTEVSSIADARENQRLMMNKYGSFLIAFIIISCLIISGLLFYQNVNARRKEIGLLKAVGKSNMWIISMILLKALILGLAGAVAGFFIGTFIAEYIGSEVFLFTASNIKPAWKLFWYAVILFPALWMAAGWIPALIASRIDAAATLSEE